MSVESMERERIRSAGQVLQDFAEIYGAAGRIVWDHYGSEDKFALKLKIDQLFPYNCQLPFNNRDKVDKMRKIVTDALWHQRKYSNKNLLMSVIFVLHSPFIKSFENHRILYQDVPEFTCHPIFRVRKCVENDDSKGCCMVFVDSNGRVYQNWNKFKKCNTLPQGVIIAPYLGVYDFDNNQKVIVDVFSTPASKMTKKLASTIDKAGGAIGLSAAAVSTATLAFPLAAPVVIGSLVAGAGVGIWSAVRSSVEIHDRNVHEQSIDIRDRAARQHWLGIGSGVLGVASAGAVKALSMCAVAGKEISAAVQVGVNGINVAALAVNTAGAGNSVAELILKLRDDELIHSLDIVQLAASLFLITHSVSNYRTAKNIIESSKVATVGGFKAALATKMRNIFDGLSKVTTNSIAYNANGLTTGDLVRTLNRVPDLYNGNSNPEPLSAVSGDNYNDEISRLAIDSLSYIASKILILDLCNLEIALKNIYQNLRESAARKLIFFSVQIYQKFIGEIEEILRTHVPFESFFWDLFMQIKVMETNIADTAQRVLALTFDFLEELVMQFYRRMVPVARDRIVKCRECNGFYSEVSL